MNRLVVLTAVATLMGCGSQVATPSANPATVPAALGASLSFFSVGQTAQGLGSPTTVTLRLFAVEGTSSDAIERAVFKMTSDNGETLAEAQLVSQPPIPVGTAFASQAPLTQTLTWAIERGYGRRLDVTVTVRDGAGNTRVLPFSRSF